MTARDVRRFFDDVAEEYRDTPAGMRAHHTVTARAIESFQRVLEEYAWSPVALSKEDVETIVEPADHLLRRCLQESGSGEEALRLLGQESRLLEELKTNTDDLLDQERAHAEADGNMHRLCERAVGEGLAALKRGERRTATRAFEDVLTLLTWFPDLDPDGKLRRAVDQHLKALYEPRSGE